MIDRFREGSPSLQLDRKDESQTVTKLQEKRIAFHLHQLN